MPNSKERSPNGPELQAEGYPPSPQDSPSSRPATPKSSSLFAGLGLISCLVIAVIHLVGRGFSLTPLNQLTAFDNAVTKAALPPMMSEVEEAISVHAVPDEVRHESYFRNDPDPLTQASGQIVEEVKTFIIGTNEDRGTLNAISIPHLKIHHDREGERVDPQTHPWTQGLIRLTMTEELVQCMVVDGLQPSGDDIVYLMETTGDINVARLVQLTFKKGWDLKGQRDLDPSDWVGSHHPLIETKLLEEIPIAGKNLFGEGIVQIPGTSEFLYPMWQNFKAYHLKLNCVGGSPKLSIADVYRYPLKAWGFAIGGDTLYATDGSFTLYSWPLKPLIAALNIEDDDARRVSVATLFNKFNQRSLTCDGSTIPSVNEIHYHVRRATIIGMQFSSRRHNMFEFDPQTGHCVSKYLFNDLGPPQPKATTTWQYANAVFNGVVVLKEGIVPSDDEILVTGKLWDSLFLIRPTEGMTKWSL